MAWTPRIRLGFVPMHPVRLPILRASLCMAERAVGYVFAFQCATQVTSVHQYLQIACKAAATARSSSPATGWGRVACMRVHQWRACGMVPYPC